MSARTPLAKNASLARAVRSPKARAVVALSAAAALALANAACGGDSAGPGEGAGAGSSSGGPSVSSSTSGGGASVCTVFPGDNWWNTDVSQSPLDANSDNYVSFLDAIDDGPLHADFDSCCQDGIPFAYVDDSVTKVDVSFTYADDSDKGPYPIPSNVPQENGSDGHVILVDTSECKLYELFAADDSSGQWQAGSGAIFDLTSNALRPDCLTSADAAGLPIFPGLVRYDEVSAGAIDHALRFTVDKTQQAWIKPARHQASSETSHDAPPMGLRFRLKNNAHVNGILAAAGPQPKVVMTALQTYGMFVADNGSNWYVSGEPSSHWDDDSFHEAFDQIHGDDFEVVDTGETIEFQSECH
ncbi:MAG TPA: hypothetical protein VGM56_28550 [Byssovorax sp.]|jgi:hypothetical protein